MHPVVALLGPRQSGKTTIARHYSKKFKEVDFFDQRKRKILILGSASRELIQQSTETLAGRISYIEVAPFSLQETGDDRIERLWLRGGFPVSYLATTEKKSYIWRNEYISTYLERDIPQLGFQIPANHMRRFWQMLTHHHGQIFNASELGQSLQLTHPTVRKYLDILVGTFMVRELKPWYANIAKRQVKSPKIYFRDSGILHTLLTLENKKQLVTHPKLGASWEGFVLEQLIQMHQLEECYFWSVHAQAELDLLVLKGGKKIGFEIKYQDAPVMTKSMVMARELLNLDRLVVIYPGKKDYKLEKNIYVYSVHSLAHCFKG